MPAICLRGGRVIDPARNFDAQADVLVRDGWVERIDLHGNHGALRAFPPRMIHMLAGNSPTGCISSIAQGALVKAINRLERTKEEAPPAPPPPSQEVELLTQIRDALSKR